MKRFVLVRVNRDPRDVHSAEVRGGGPAAMTSALHQALDLANPDRGSFVEVGFVMARDANSALRAPSRWKVHSENYGDSEHRGGQGVLLNPSKSEGGRLVIKKAASAGVPKVISTPEDAARAVQKLIGDNIYESFFVLYVNARNMIIGHEELSEDGLTSVSVNTASIVRNALLAGAPAVITIHNHPTGSMESSVEDRTLWRQLREQLTVFGIVCLDNLIVGGDGFYSEESDSVTRLKRRP